MRYAEDERTAGEEAGISELRGIYTAGEEVRNIQNLKQSAEEKRRTERFIGEENGRTSYCGQCGRTGI